MIELMLVNLCLEIIELLVVMLEVNFDCVIVLVCKLIKVIGEDDDVLILLLFEEELV